MYPSQVMAMAKSPSIRVGIGDQIEAVKSAFRPKDARPVRFLSFVRSLWKRSRGD